MDNINICYMVDFRNLNKLKIPPCKRIYFGHETCEKKLPLFHEIQNLLDISEKNNLELTFVTPFLTNKGIENVLIFLNQLKKVKPNFEVVVSDWGLLNQITSNKLGTPVISRFMIGQQCDFRLTRFFQEQESEILSINKDHYKLCYKKPSQELEEHLASCTLLKEQTLELLNKLGVNRFELNNTFLPIKLPETKKYNYSLHLPFVPLSIFKSCPKNLDFNKIHRECSDSNCMNNHSEWLHDTLVHKIYCFDNALYYLNHDYELKLVDNRINRIIFDQTKSLFLRMFAY